MEQTVTDEITRRNHQRGGPKCSMFAYSVIFSFTRRTHVPLLATASLLSILAGMVPSATSILVGKLMNSFSQFDAGAIDGDDLQCYTQPWVLGLVTLGSAAFVVRALFYCAWIVNGELQTKVVREDLFSSLVIRDFEWFEAQTSGVGSLLGRIQVQIREFQLGVSQPLGMVVMIISQTILSLSVAFFYSWKLTLVLLAVFPLIALALSLLVKGLQRAVDDQNKEMANAAKQVANATNNVTLLKCLNGLPKEIRRYELTLQSILQHYRRQAKKAARQIAFMRLAGIALVVIALSFGTYLIHDAGANPGTVLSTFWCCGTASRGFNEILAQSMVLEKGRASAQALKSLICFVQSGKKLGQESHTCTPQTLVGNIDFQNVNFAYPSNIDRPVLDQLTLSFQARQITFVVGRSGSGKSTISHLLLKLYTLQGGQITIDGKNLGQLDTNWLRNNITVVQQDSVLFNETLSKNIALGHRDPDEVRERQISDCTDFAVLADTIKNLPGGINTMVGKGGCKLSGGQRQRIALARARLRDAPILVLDESTSALDHATRVRLLENIRAWRKDKSTIIITHDVSQIKPHDLTCLLKDGALVAQGHRSDLDSLINWPAGTHENATSDASPAISEENGNQPTDQSFYLKHSNVSKGSLYGDVIQGTYGEHVALLPAGTKQSFATKSDRGKAFRAFLRSKDYRISWEASSRPDNLDHGLELTIHDSEYEMSKMTKSRVIRKRLTMTQAARPYSAYPSLTVRHADPYEELRPAVPPLKITTPSGYRNGSTYTAVSASEEVDDTAMVKPPSLRKILVTVWPSLPIAGRHWLVFALATSIVYGMVPSVVSWITVKLFQTFYQANGWVEDSRRWSLILMAVALVESVAAFSIHLLFETLAQTWINVLRLSALTAVLSRPKSWFDEENISINEICTTIDRGAEEMRNILGRFVPFLLIVLIMVLASIIVCFIRCWKLTLVGIGCAPLVYIITKVYQMTSVSWESRTTDAVNNISDVFAESFSDVRTIRALTLESFFHRKFMTANLQAFIIGLKRGVLIGLCFGMSESLAPFIIAIVFKFAIIVARSQEFPTQNILIVLSSMIFTMLGASAILAFIPQISSSVESGGRLLQLAEVDSKVEEHHGQLKPDIDEFVGTVELRGINFSYPTRPGIAILKDVDLILPSGKITAIVGSSGSGKSTILSLILGLYPATGRTPQSSLRVSGHDIKELDISNLRSFIAYVPQQPVLFPMSIRDNVLYGVHTGLTTCDNLLYSAAKAAGIHDFIVSLPEAYDTLVGDGGSSMSGGQAQRVVVARALATQPKILLMDEPTSALDPESAGVIRSTISAQRNQIGWENRSVIIVTHCEETMKLADTVVVFEEGTVAEHGSYHELMASRGWLRQLLGRGQIR